MFSRDQTPTGTFLMVANNYCTCTSTLARELSTSTLVASELASASDSSFFSWPSFLCAFVLDILCDNHFAIWLDKTGSCIIGRDERKCVDGWMVGFWRRMAGW